MAANNIIPIPYLRECFDYDPEAGVLRWRERPPSHFKNERARGKFAPFIGKPAGSMNNGYLGVTLTYNRLPYQRIYVHRIIWALVTGEWPENEIDHIDGNRSNNRFFNLRLATVSEQAQNRSQYVKKKDGRKGLIGTSFHKREGLYWATIVINRRQHHLGCFDTEEEAHSAYLKAKLELHIFQPKPR